MVKGIQSNIFPLLGGCVQLGFLLMYVNGFSAILLN
jgi:hypothetical protein